MTSQRRLGALVGVVSAAAGLAASELVSGYLHQRVSPVVAVAESIIRLTPGAIIEKVISVVGRNDKPLVIGATLLGLLVVSAIVGIVAMRALAVAEAVFVAMGIVLVLAVHARLTSSETTYVPAVVGVVVALVALATLTPRAVRTRSQPAGAETDQDSRRDFLRLTAGVAGGVVLAGVAGRVLAHGRAALDAARTKLQLPASRPVAPAGAEIGVKGIAAWNTSQDDFYRIDTALFVPHIEPGTWRLRIHGMVGRELTIDLPTLLRRPMVERDITLACVSNPVGGSLVGNARWLGVPLAPLLAEVGISPDADQLVSRDSGGTSIGTPIATVTDGRDALLAVGMNGEPLPFEHGFPVRMVVPGLYGYVSACKWITDIEVTRFDAYDAYWVRRGWAPRGPVKVSSRIDTPRDGHRRPAGPGVVAGVAWAQHTGIARVEVRVDDGPWAQADLAPAATADTWRLWTWPWNAPAGEHALTVRAVTTAGQVQTADRADTVPDGATGLHTVRVAVTG